MPNLNKEILDTDTDIDSVDSDHIEYIDVENLNSPAALAEPTPLVSSSTKHIA